MKMKTSKFSRIVSLVIILAFALTLMPANYAFAANDYTFTLTSGQKSVKAGEKVTLTVTLNGAMDNLTSLQYTVKFDTTAFSASKAMDEEVGIYPQCFDTEWYDSLGSRPGTNLGKGLGFIGAPQIADGIEDGEAKIIYSDLGGRRIDEKSDLWGKTETVAGKLVFTAKKDVDEISSKYFTLLEGKNYLVLNVYEGEDPVPQTVKAVQLPSSGEPVDPDKEKVDAVIAKIAALPEVDALTLDDETAVNEAKTAFDALNAENQAKVTNSDKLTKALAKIAELKKAAEDDAKVKAVIDAINALPAVDALTLADEIAVNEAKTAFDALDADLQAKVTNSDKLTKAIAKIEELKKPPVSNEYTFTLTSGQKSVKAGEKVTLTVTLNGAMDNLTSLQYTVKFDTTAFSASKAMDEEVGIYPQCFDTEWYDSLGSRPGTNLGKGLGFIGAPQIADGIEDGEAKIIYSDLGGRRIDEKSDLWGKTETVAGKLVFTAKKDVDEISSKYFTLLEGKNYLVLNVYEGEDPVPQTVKAVQLPSSGEPVDPDKEKVDAVIAKIAALPEVDALTLDDETAVNEAKTAFDALNAENQAKVTNSDKLTKALAKIEELKAAASDQEKVDAVIKMINDLPATDALTLADKEAVASASAAYEALGELKGKVTNADKLTAAINKIADLEKDKDAADKVIALIDAIDAEITLDSEKGITDARTAYDALTPAQKALISAEKLEVLTNAEAELKGIKADKAAADNVIKMIDDICASEITVGSRAAIDAAKKAYDELNGNSQKFVGEDKYNELLEADKKCKELEDAADQDTKDTAAAEAFTKAVNDLEDATYENVDTVEAAVANLRSQYDSLTDGAKAKIDEKVLAKLTEIEEKVKTIKNDIAKANETKALIKAIGTVTLDSADAIKAARDSYDALENAEQKALVDNAPDGENTATLEAAEKAYAAIKEDNDKADATIKLIDDIGEVTIDSGDKIKAARESFDSLTDAQKEKVKKAGKEEILVKAEADYKAIVDANKPVVSGNKKPAFTDMFDGGLYVVLVENVPTGKKVTVDGIEGYEYKDADGKIKYVVASNREMNTDNITVEDATDAKPFILGAFTNPTGALNAADAYIINKLSALIKDDTTNPLFADPYTMLRADVNGDGIINAADALLVARHAAGDATAPALKFVEIATIDAE